MACLFAFNCFTTPTVYLHKPLNIRDEFGILKPGYKTIMETIVACALCIIYGPRMVKEIISAQNLQLQLPHEQESIKRYSAVISISHFHCTGSIISSVYMMVGSLLHL